MAKSRFEYVRSYETPDPLIPNTFIVVRIDGRGFHRFSDAHSFEKPNDRRALDLMDLAAKTVMDEYKDVVLAFGESDEYSFLLRRTTKLYNRRRSKISSSVVSLFTSAYVFNWSQFFPSTPLVYPPSFDSRVVLYPGEKEIRDYFGWRQADTHINNLYNTSFWALVKSGQTTAEANKALQGTDSKDKNEILFSRFGVNYNTLPAMYRKGSICLRQPTTTTVLPAQIPADGENAQTEAGPSSVRDVARMAGQHCSDSSSRSDSVRVQEADNQSAQARSGINTTAGEEAGEAGDVRPNEEKKTSGRRRRRGKTENAKPYEGIDGEVVVVHEDLIGNEFWEQRPAPRWRLNNVPPGVATNEIALIGDPSANENGVRTDTDRAQSETIRVGIGMGTEVAIAGEIGVGIGSESESESETGMMGDVLIIVGVLHDHDRDLAHHPADIDQTIEIGPETTVNVNATPGRTGIRDIADGPPLRVNHLLPIAIARAKAKAKERRRRKEKKREKKAKKEKKRKGTAASTAKWGQYGIISETDIVSKDSEFRAWLVEERMINPETISKDRTKKEFAVFVEDYNTATLPHEKYYDMAKYDIKMNMIRSGQTLPDESGGYDPFADMKAHSSGLKSQVKQQETLYSREQIEELRRVEAERTQVAKRKQMGLEVPRNLGVRTEEYNPLTH
ncbi:tRNA(His) guanylyltransferase [Kwoniella heveanensis CBS 569]|nr:tRNA(His) guanylyltransferase [Kwoniella heveanensis CBS 569]